MFENDFLPIGDVYDQGPTANNKSKDDFNVSEHYCVVSDGRKKQFIDGRVNPVLERNIEADQGTPQESFFSVKLVNKDKVRRRGGGDQGKENECGNGVSFLVFLFIWLQRYLKIIKRVSDFLL